MPRNNGQIPIEAMFGGERPAGDVRPAGPPPGEMPLGPADLEGGGPGGMDQEGAIALISLLLEIPEMRSIIEEKLALREEAGIPAGRGRPNGGPPVGPERGAASPPPPPMSASGEPLPGEPGPDAGVTPFLDRLSRERGGRR